MAPKWLHLIVMLALLLGSASAPVAAGRAAAEAPSPASLLAAPEIRSVTSDYPFGGHYLAGISVPNTLRATVDLKGQGGYVKFIINGEEHRVNESSGGVFAYSLDLGRLPALVTTIRTIAYNDAGQTSDHEDHMFLALPSMKWLGGVKAGKFEITGRGYDAAYVARAQFPADGMLFNAQQFISPEPGDRTKLGLVMAGSITVPVICQPGHPIVLEGRASDLLEATLYVLHLKGDLSADARISQQFVDCSIVDPQLEGTLNASAKLSAGGGSSIHKIVKDVIGDYWSDVVSLLVVGDMGVDGSLNTELQANAKAEVTSPYFRSTVGLNSQLGLDGRARIFFGLLWSSVFETYFGGNGGLVYASPGYLGDFKDLYFAALYGHNLHLILSDWWGAHRWYEKTFEVECRYPLKGAQSCLGKKQVVLEAGWTPHGMTPDYAGFATPAARAPLARDSYTALASGPISTTLASGVYTYTRASLAVNPADGRAMMLWTHDVPTKTLGTSHEIFFSLWDGLHWGPAAPLTNNDALDEAAQLAWTADGRAVAVWNQLDPAAPADDFEVVSAVYDPALRAWGPVTPLTHNDVFDAGGPLTRNRAGKLMTAWAEQISSPGQTPAAGGETARLMAAFYDGGWGAPQIVTQAVPDLAEVAVAYGEAKAAIAFTRVVTPTGAQTPIRQMYLSLLDGTAWSLPLPLANTDQDQDSPNLWFDSADHLNVAWRTGQLLHTLDITTGAHAEIPLADGQAAVDRVRVLPQASDDLVIVGRRQAGASDLLTVYFDPTTQLPSAPRPLTSDPAMEGAYGAALGMDGRLLLAFPSTQLASVPASMRLSDGATLTFTVPAPDRTDLVALAYRLGRNLTLAPDALSIATEHPLPGTALAVTATVANTGDLPLGGVLVRFYDGDPQAGGVPFADAPLIRPLAGGAQALAAATYTLPADGALRDLYAVVDPDNRIAEDNEDDNLAHRRTFGPDLAVQTEVEPAAGDRVLLHAWVSNLGPGGAPPTTLAFGLGASPAAVTATLPALGAGQAVTLTLPWQFGQLAAGAHKLVAHVNQDDFPELNLANNAYTATLGVRPDLAVSPADLSTGPVGTAPLAITLTLHNVGVITATDVLVGVYDGWRLDAAAQVFTRTLPLLGPGESATLTGVSLRPATCGVFVWVDPLNAIDENKENNLASIRGVLDTCAAQTYLPVLRLGPASAR